MNVAENVPRFSFIVIPAAPYRLRKPDNPWASNQPRHL
jgi:hypothetical protein